MAEEPKPQITFGKFQNVDLRAALIVSAPLATGTRARCRLIGLDLGPLGERQSVGQFALAAEQDLVGSMVIACINLGAREMGPYTSDALVLGTAHPESPEGEDQALPLRADRAAAPGDRVY
jgi:tRNA-binding protein